MKREIKFRVWDTKNKIMVTDENWEKYKGNRMLGFEYYKDEWYPVYAVLEMICPHTSEGFEKMQYTGLKDKNGKEIYEGDIVEFKANYTNKPCGWRKGVIFITPYFLGISCVYPIPNWNESEDFNWFYYAQEETDEFPYTSEVIGNIYENPELLKQ